jgi:hypothetical protein
MRSVRQLSELAGREIIKLDIESLGHVSPWQVFTPYALT